MTSLDKFHQVMRLVVMVCGRHCRACLFAICNEMQWCMRRYFACRHVPSVCNHGLGHMSLGVIGGKKMKFLWNCILLCCGTLQNWHPMVGWSDVSLICSLPAPAANVLAAAIRIDDFVVVVAVQKQKILSANVWVSMSYTVHHCLKFSIIRGCSAVGRSWLPMRTPTSKHQLSREMDLGRWKFMTSAGDDSDITVTF